MHSDVTTDKGQIAKINLHERDAISSSLCQKPTHIQRKGPFTPMVIHEKNISVVLGLRYLVGR